MLAFGGRLPSLFIMIIIGALTVGPAWAQDLDQDKSGAKLFATNCTDCHRSPRGLAKDRFSWTLSYFLQQHYTSGPASAHALTAYLQSVDAPRAKQQPASRTSLPPATSGSEAPLRPPAPVPVR
jgi:mono/diheme cytochrome c family protein